jgi:adenylate cyclase
MKLKLKSKKIIGKIILINFLLTLFVCLAIYVFNIPWNTLDYKAIDSLYKKNLRDGNGPQKSKKIVLLNITDSTYNYFKSNYLSRTDLAKINNTLYYLNPEEIFYDIVFPRSSTDSSDAKFTHSIKQLGNVYLPVGFNILKRKNSFQWGKGFFYNFLKSGPFKNLKEEGNGSPYFASYALPQNDIFANAAYNTGHISIVRDNDGIIRHCPLIIKIDSLAFPTVSFQMFLDYNKISFNKIIINWGQSIVIPSVKGSYLNKKIVIPIDKHGMSFVPFPDFWKDATNMQVQNLLKYSLNENNLDDLMDYFGGKFIFISDISVGTSDLGQTTVEDNVPLVSVHAALLNAFLTNNFYSEWKALSTVLLIFPLGLVLGFFSIFKKNIPLYISAVIIISALVLFSFFEIRNFQLFPLITASGAVFVLSVGMILSLNIIISKDQAFIKNAFSKYVPANVVDELLENPRMLKLGGEERILTILFSDIAGFTTISENMKSTDLVHFLNDYLTEMTDIIINEKGTIDKYIGDAILAEYGAPMPMENHAEAAVRTALTMQNKIKELNDSWISKGFPNLKSRIGINTGMVIIGNMGSDRVFDYTAIGDSVNLAARLETANKRYNTFIMISEFTYDKLDKNLFKTRLLDIIKVKGKTKAVKVYEVYGFASDSIVKEDEEYYRTYEKAFGLYLAKNFIESKINFEQSLNFRPDDPASGQMLQRIKNLEEQELDENWDGSIMLLEK